MGELLRDAEAIRASLETPERFEPIFERHFGAIHRYVERRLGRALAEEIAADVFLSEFAVRSRHDVSRASARPWLFGIAAPSGTP